MLPPSIEAEIAELAARHGQPRRVDAELRGRPFHPLSQADRYGEVCMVLRRPSGKLLTAIKTFYPAGAFRLLTGGGGHGEPIGDALLREVAEETGLDVVVSRFLAVIEYHLAAVPGASWPTAAPAATPASIDIPQSYSFVTFAFLLDEVGGELTVSDPDERIGAFREVAVGELPALAETLEQSPDAADPEIDGSWRDWGRFRAIVHRVVYAALSEPGAC